MILYPITFWKIHKHNNQVSRSNILGADVMKQRKANNTLNIVMTFNAWLVQLFSNLIVMLLYKVVFGKYRFLHSLMAVVSSSLNFTVFPFIFIILSEHDYKVAFAQKSYLKILLLLFDMSAVSKDYG